MHDEKMFPKHLSTMGETTYLTVHQPTGYLGHFQPPPGTEMDHFFHESIDGLQLRLSLPYQ